MKSGQLSRILVLLTVTLMMASMTLGGQASAEHTWTEEVLDQTEAAGFASSIRIDNFNNPVIAYGSIHGLNYTVKSGSTWTTEQVSKNMTFHTDLKLDSSGNPHIACIFDDYFTEEIKYASKSGGIWTNTTILNNVHTEGYLSLELTGNDVPYILCQLADSAKTLAIFYPSGNAWVQENITLYGGWESYDMAIGGGDIHVVYENASANEIIYASRPVSGGSWQFEKLMDGGITSGAVSMDVDSSGNPHILIGFQHMWKNGGSWLSEPLDMIYSGMDYLDLYIDSNDGLHAAIFVSYSLIYGQKTDSNWEFEAVRTEMDGDLCSVVADSNGMPHISQFSINNYQLKYHAGTPASTDPDSDSDGLSDIWENNNFGDLNQDATDDPDDDGHDNLDEYTNGTDPMDSSDPLVEIIDSDDDGLPDSWEITNFGDLDQNATGDPDNDIFDNLAEYNAGTDPNDPESIPFDIDLDGLKTILMWIVISVIVVIAVIVLIFFLCVKVIDDEASKPQKFVPSAFPPPNYQTQAPPPPTYCPGCGRQSRFVPPNGNWCDSCGKYL